MHLFYTYSSESPAFAFGLLDWVEIIREINCILGVNQGLWKWSAYTFTSSCMYESILETVGKKGQGENKLHILAYNTCIL